MNCPRNSLRMAPLFVAIGSPWPFAAESSGCRTSASRTLFNALTAARRGARTIRSAPSTRTSASCRCRTRACDALAAHRASRRRSCRRRWSSSTSRAWCAGASKGEGLGNQFLANIRETDAIAHVVRCFENDNVIHVEGRVDPAARHRDHRHRADARGSRDGVEKASTAPRRPAKGGDKEDIARRELLEQAAGHSTRASRRATFSVR